MSEIQIPEWAKKAIDARSPDYNHSAAAIYGACIIIECLEKTRQKDTKNEFALISFTISIYNKGRESVRKEVLKGINE
jgi:hypothetical protein